MPISLSRASKGTKYMNIHVKIIFSGLLKRPWRAAVQLKILIDWNWKVIDVQNIGFYFLCPKKSELERNDV
uniref:Uncharacterized protein n=1 Tax=Oryza barthii TaxID=65489 RepID=A0A0D3GN94_9ORYZ